MHRANPSSETRGAILSVHLRFKNTVSRSPRQKIFAYRINKADGLFVEEIIPECRKKHITKVDIFGNDTMTIIEVTVGGQK